MTAKQQVIIGCVLRVASEFIAHHDVDVSYVANYVPMNIYKQIHDKETVDEEVLYTQLLYIKLRNAWNMENISGICRRISKYICGGFRENSNHYIFNVSNVDHIIAPKTASKLHTYENMISDVLNEISIPTPAGLEHATKMNYTFESIYSLRSKKYTEVWSAWVYIGSEIKPNESSMYNLYVDTLKSALESSNRKNVSYLMIQADLDNLMKYLLAGLLEIDDDFATCLIVVLRMQIVKTFTIEAYVHLYETSVYLYKFVNIYYYDIYPAGWKKYNAVTPIDRFISISIEDSTENVYPLKFKSDTILSKRIERIHKKPYHHKTHIFHYPRIVREVVEDEFENDLYGYLENSVFKQIPRVIHSNDFRKAYHMYDGTKSVFFQRVLGNN